MADDFIKREALIKEISSISITMNIGQVNNCKTLLENVIKSYCQAVLKKVKEAPAADVVEVRHGEWKDTDWAGVSVKGYMACSQCNVMIPTCDDNRYCLGYLYFCPNCGAKMDGKGD